MDNNLIEVFSNQFPEAYMLSCAISIPPKIEPELIRKIRIELFPNMDAGAEADIWFSPLVQTRTPSAIVFFPKVLDILRNNLAGDQKLLKNAWNIIADVHKHVSPALRLEEEIVYLALLKGDRGNEIEQKLNSVLSAIVQENRTGLVQWAFRALPQLPAKARISESALILALNVGTLQGQTIQLGELPQTIKWEKLSWAVPKDIPRVSIGIRLIDTFIEIGDVSLLQANLMKIPKTNPLMLEITWGTGKNLQNHIVTWELGQSCILPGWDSGDIQIRNVFGEMYLISPVFRASAARLKAICLESPFLQNKFSETPLIQFFHVKENNLLEVIKHDEDIDLIILDTDFIPDVSAIIDHIRDENGNIPIVIISQKMEKNALMYLRLGANWYINKDDIHQNVDEFEKAIRENLFVSIDWEKIYAESEKSRPYLDVGLDPELSSRMEPDEKYILKKLFPRSQEIHVIKVKTELEQSRIYRVKSDDEPTQIVKIETLANISRVKEKFERLIVPRLDRYIGQMGNRVVKGQLLGGASYMLAGSNQDQETNTLTSFLLDRNKLREESIKDALSCLQKLLDQLYVGNVEHQARYWAPYYSKLLPCLFEVADAEFLPNGTGEVGYILKSEDFKDPVDVYDNPVLVNIKEQLRANSASVTITIKDFEIAEINTAEGVIYVQDNIIFNQPLPTSRFFPSKDHPLLRIKIRVAQSNKKLLLDPLIRSGKRISVKGIVKPETFQENLLLSKIKNILPDLYKNSEVDNGGRWENIIELSRTRFIDPILCINLLLWEIGREDVNWPPVLLCPVIHGDLNTNNILVESKGETHVWLIDFTESTYGHIYYDLAKLEVEIRTHVLYRIFQEMCSSGKWTETTAIQVALLIENLLFEEPKYLSDLPERIAQYGVFFPSSKRSVEWHNQVLKEYHLYWKKLLVTVAGVRSMASTMGRPEQFEAHYPVALFFQSIAALKFSNLDHGNSFPWAKRLAYICALVSGTRALRACINQTSANSAIREAVESINESSSFGIIRRRKGNRTQFLLQNVPSWNTLNLIGGKMSFLRDRNDYSITMQRELMEELGLRITDYQITKEYDVLRFHQFSERDAVHKEYEFHLFEITLSKEASNSISLKDESAADPDSRWNYWASLSEINNLKTIKGFEISPTTKKILQELGLFFAS